MDSVRWATSECGNTPVSCCRCDAGNGRWDRLAGKPYCPHCQEMLVLGEAAPLVEPTHSSHCAVCARVGTVTFTSFPLDGRLAVDMELCSEHIRALLGRRLGSYAFHQLCRQLRALALV